MTSPARTAGLTAAFAAAIGGMASAQDEAGGVRLSLGIEQRIEAIDNLALAEDSAGTTTRIGTEFDASLVSRTRTQSLGLSLGTSLRAVESPQTPSDGAFELAAPDVELSYARTAAGAAFEAALRYDEDEVAFLRRLDDFVTAEGILVLPEDILTLADLAGTGTRRVTVASVALRLGEDAPLSLGLGARATRIRYDDVSATNLFDSDRLRLTLDAGLRLSAADRLGLSVGYVERDSDDPDVADDPTLSVEAVFAAERRGLTLTFGSSVSETGEDTRAGVEAGIVRALREGRLGAELGLSRTSSGEEALTGSLDFTRRLSPDATLSAQALRGLSDVDDGGGEVFTVLSLGYDQQLTPLLGLDLDARLAAVTDLSDDTTVSDGSLGIGVDRALSRDWSLGVGLRGVFRRDEGLGDGWRHSQSVYLTLRRDIERRY